jgi:uncharacterized protein YdhG (YjbR/CyaY superfamily)
VAVFVFVKWRQLGVWRNPGAVWQDERGLALMVRKPTSIDAYLAGVKGEKRAALDKLRKTIRAIVPKAEECISYGLPAFRLDGKIVAGFAATAKGCAYYPFSGSTLRSLADELEGYDGTKGSLHFDPAEPLPTTLVRKLLKARIAER